MVIRLIDKDEMESYYFEDPAEKDVIRELNNGKIHYFYFNEKFSLDSKQNEIINACLLSGTSKLTFGEKSFAFSKFDMVFLPPESKIILTPDPQGERKCKICVYSTPVQGNVSAKFEIQRYSSDMFISRGELSSQEKMATYRTVWTAIKNGFFMSGFTNIPNKVLRQGVVTSVNLEKSEDGETDIYPHIHPDFPEVYIYCIDDSNYAVTQYLVNEKGQSVSKDLSDGEGVFFPGNLGHINFAKPTTKKMGYCQYMWMISTYGKAETINPVTLKL